MLQPKTSYEKAAQGHLIPTPQLLNQFEDDEILQSLLQRILPPSAYQSILPDLRRLGEDTATYYSELAKEQEMYQPKLQKYDAFGHNINKLILCSAWNKQHDIAAKEGVVALGYKSNKYSANIDRKYWRIYQYTKLLLWEQSSGLYSCPIAMTDGAAKLLSIICSKPTESINNSISSQNMSILRDAFNHLISFDDNSFWTSGQWMTERGGGSDVTQNGTNTIAKQQQIDSDDYRLFGYKWFSSATDANIAIALARIEEYNDDKVISGSNGVSCFYIPNVKHNNVDIVQLKDKLGTKQLPTAELQLNGSKAILLSKKGKGIQTIMVLANITRIHNAISSCGAIKRTLSMIRAYASERIVYNKRLSNIPLHQRTLANIDCLYRICLYFTMECVKLIGISEHDVGSTDSELLLRLLTPLCKLYTAKCAVFCVSEGIECMGGIGYLETSNMARIYRDAQVLPVWEGTTNVLSLDVLRVLNNDKYGKKSFDLYCKRIEDIIALNISDNIALNDAFCVLKRFIMNYIHLSQVYARDISYSFCRIYCAALLYEDWYYTKNDIHLNVYKRFVNGNMQSCFVGGDCGKCLVSQSLINLMQNNTSKEQLQYLDKLGMGSYSKL